MTTVKQFQKLEPAKKAAILADLLDECAERCGKNFLFAGTWIEASFAGAAERSRDIERQLRKSKKAKSVPKCAKT